MIDRNTIIQFRKFIELMSENATDEQALDNVVAFPKWEIGKEYKKDFRLRYNDVLYKVLQDHTSQAEWTPDIAVSLYVKVSEEEFPEWKQPQGSHDAYMKNDKVRHLTDEQGNERHWISTMDYNTYEPGVYGWDEL